MRSHTYIFAGLIIFLVFGAIGIFVFGINNTPPFAVPSLQVDAIPKNETVTPVSPPPLAEETPTETGSGMINVTTPLPHAKVKSPLVITGTARGNWYFEASFPIQLVDANGGVIAQTPAQAQGDWMTDNFVPFTATLTWATTTATSGTLMLKRDNPSGLPENDRSVSIPVNL